MGTAWSFRSRRRTVAERDALARVEREIRATDPNGRRKYLRDFREAFPAYRSVVTEAEVAQQLAASNVVLIADYHALPASQRYATKVLETVRARGRKVVLALEMVFSRDQHILDEWMADETDLDEVRERLRFDFEWGYSWEPFRELLQSARRYAEGVFGLDCMPRHDMRRISARDKHAAAKIAEIRDRFPDAVVIVLFGESHLAPTHLPRWLAERRPGDVVTTVLQNVDALYWQAANEKLERVDAARLSPDVLCVFNATPLEKYESYRMCIERWRQEPTASPDLAPTFYNLIDSLLAFLHIDKYSAHNGRQPKFLVDLFPEVCARADLEALRRLLLRKRAGEPAAKETIKRIHEHGSCYLPRMNAMFVHEFRMAECAEEAAHFVHHACRGLVGSSFGERSAGSPEDVFYRRVIEEALGFFGSRALCPTRPAVRETDLYALYAQPREAIEERTIYSYREYMQMIDFLVLHRDFETHHGRYWIVPELIKEGLQYSGEKLEFVVQQLGAMLGSDIYEAYVAGRISRRFIRSLFFRDLEARSAARSAYFVVARRVRSPRKRWLA